MMINPTNKKEYIDPCEKLCINHRYHCGTCYRALGYSPANYASRLSDIPNYCKVCIEIRTKPLTIITQPSDSKREEKCKKHGVVHKNGGYPSCNHLVETNKMVSNLSELIKKCGNRFRWLEQRIYNGVQEGDKWLVQARGEKYLNPDGSQRSEKDVIARGATPEEALLNLINLINK